jgi:hypothetical protein
MHTIGADRAGRGRGYAGVPAGRGEAPVGDPAPRLVAPGEAPGQREVAAGLPGHCVEPRRLRRGQGVGGQAGPGQRRLAWQRRRHAEPGSPRRPATRRWSRPRAPVARQHEGSVPVRTCTRPQPAAWSASSWSAWFCSRVETLAYPDQHGILPKPVGMCHEREAVSRDGCGRPTGVPDRRSLPRRPVSRNGRF